LVRGILTVLGCVLIFMSCKTQEQAADLPPKNPATDLFRDYFHQAIGEKMIGHYDRAIELFGECLKLEPNSSAVHFALSDLYELQGNKMKAIEFAKRAFDLDKMNKWYALRLADLYFGIGDYANSATYYDLGIDDEEQNLDLKFKYAEALIYSNQYQKAIDMMNVIEVETGKIPQLSLTKHDMYMALGQEEKAQAELNSLINEDPSNVENRVFVAEYFLSTNQAEKAKQVALDAIKIDPESGSAYVVLADVEIRSGNITAAFEHLKTAFTKDDVMLERKLELLSGLMSYAFSADPEAATIQQGIGDLFSIIYDPALKNPRLHSIYGTFLQQQGKKTEALAQFRMVCELNKDDYQAWDNLLNIEYDLNAYQDMFNDGQKAIELFPSQPMLYLLTGIGAYESGHFDEAEEYLFLGKDLVIQNNELLAEFYYHLGKVSGIQTNYAEAYTNLDQAKKILPQFGKAYGAKARFLFEEGKTPEAQQEVKAGLAIEPNNASLLHIQGLIYLQQKDYPAALKTLERAAINGYTNGDILESYGDALYLNGDKEKAMQIWIEAEKNGNNSAVLKRKIADKMYYEN
jgi:tetratricopeptide (TPR) repeat protein